MRRLLLVRHAQSEWNAAGRWQGRADPDLSPGGRRAVAGAGPELASELAGEGATGLAALVASDLRRAVATAAGLGAAVGWTDPPREVAGLAEHDVGEWTGCTREEIERRWPGMLGRWGIDRREGPPGGEGWAAFDARVRTAVGLLAAAAPEGVTLAVTHGGVLRSVARWLGVPGHPVANLEGYLLDADGPTLRRDVHLGRAAPTPAR